MATGEVFERFVNDIFNESESEEEFGGSDSEEDNVEINNEDSESEQSADELEVNGDDEMDEDLSFYIGKNQLTLWMNKPLRQNVRVLDRNVITAMHAPGVKPAAQDDLYDMNESNEDVNTPDVTIDDYVLNEDFIDNVSVEAVNSEELGENKVILIVLPYNAHVETNESGERLENNESVEVTWNEHRQTYEERSDKSSVGLSVDNNDVTDLNVNQETTINHVTVSNVVSEYTEENIVANPEENNDHTDNPNEDRDINNIAEPKNRSRKRITTPEDWVRNVRKKSIKLERNM
ncbi:hypothetical protein J6590_106812 [Homalodisca vitripennis]|nr:hypothetical protein J6590_106812 [Homalodisca vitripennis]